jgi:hypothetical protein
MSRVQSGLFVIPGCCFSYFVKISTIYDMASPYWISLIKAQNLFELNANCECGVI